ncbi:MAG: hypothetical protein CVU00_00230 [Bacteroidetes bacterium HGW-Bacteroidetes-17]|jgi:hypothetical protein|nr:MAG: hypothetical protein CVU00_00230 [Bacteroidetes bacterium HGW-Bacteroidetes-17]
MNQKMINLSIVFVFIFSLSMSAQTKKQKKMAGYLITNYEVECMGTGMDGTQLVKIWGFGNKPEKAVYQAKKNAVHAIMFKGILGGKPGCMQRPLINDPAATEKHSDYFDLFFEDGGRYLQFVSETGDGTMDRIKVSKKEYKVGIVVSIRHSALRTELETAGIINKLGNGF